MAHHVGGDVGVGVDERVPDAGLGGEVEDAVDVGMGGSDGGKRVPVGDVGQVEMESPAAFECGQASALEVRVVVGVEIVDADHRVAAIEQGARGVHADEARDAGHQHGHPRRA